MAQSVYLSGCRGSGKTCLQHLLAKSFQEDGYEVYFFRSAEEIPQGASMAFDALLEDNSKKVAVLIDEVGSNPNSGLYTTLLKSINPNLVTIGSAVPTPFRMGSTTAQFRNMFK